MGRFTARSAMTVKKDLKRRIRERMERTGENYVTARRAVLEGGEHEPSTTTVDPPGPAFSPMMREAASVVPETWSVAEEERRSSIEVVELEEHDELAAQLGFKCTVSISRALTEQVEPRDALIKLRDVLLGTTADSTLDVMRAVVLRGEDVPKLQLDAQWYERMRIYVARVRAGIGGVSDNGTMIAMNVEGSRGMVMLVAHLGWGMAARGIVNRRPRLVLGTVEATGVYIEPIALRQLAMK
jgi:hypothetical protein